MSIPPRKVRKRFGLAPLFLAALAVAAWCGWWFYAANRISQGFDAEAKALRDRGFEVAYEGWNLGGFPFRFDLSMKNARIAEPGGWGLSAPSLQAETAAYSPNVIVLVAEDGVVLKRPDGRAFSIKGKTLRASLGGMRNTPPRVSVEGLDLTITAADGGLVAFPAIKSFRAHLRPQGDKAQLFLEANDATGSRDHLIGRIADGRPVTVKLAGEASHGAALKGQGWPGVIRSWAAAGGVFEVMEGGVQAGESLLTLKPSRFTADENGRAKGALTLTLGSASDGMLALGAIGALPPETAAVGAGLSALGGGSGIEATLTFDGGQTLLGPLPLGPAPRLY